MISPRFIVRCVPLAEPTIDAGAETQNRTGGISQSLEELISYADPRNPLLWLRNGEGMVGIGEVLRLSTMGPNRISEAAEWWNAIVADAEIDDQVGLPGTGLIAFGAFTFTGSSSVESVLSVPEYVVGRRNGRSWITHIRFVDSVGGASSAAAEDEIQIMSSVLAQAPRPFSRVADVTFRSASMSPKRYELAVAEVVEMIDAGKVDKVVLARQLVGDFPVDAGLHAPIKKLTETYPDTWVFAVDGLFGASPETLVRANHGTVSARVLAGTTDRGASPEDDRAKFEALAASPKNLAEHDLAVSSIITRLNRHVQHLRQSPAPYALQLPNLWHLATDVQGALLDGVTVLDLVDSVHPTAAVAGHPQDVAVSLIDEIEGFDRGRYAGPVGWIDADGDGEWAVALRCAQLHDDGTVEAFAGCGIVAGSNPVEELAETAMKFRPILEALGGTISA